MTETKIEVRAIDLERLGINLCFINTDAAARKDVALRNAKRLAEAFASPPVVVQEERDVWQPIETAPKDGTKYLATDGDGVRVENEPPLCYPGEWDWNASRKQWRGHAHTDLFEATHWQPLPALPAAIKGDQP